MGYNNGPTMGNNGQHWATIGINGQQRAIMGNNGHFFSSTFITMIKFVLHGWFRIYRFGSENIGLVQHIQVIDFWR